MKVRDFKERAMALAGCDCGWVEPDEIRDEGFVRHYIYRSGLKPRIPINKWCRHRRIEHALVNAYKAGRSAKLMRAFTEEVK